MLRTLLAITCYAIPMFSYAISCPSNGKIINTGDTIAQVINVCGNPNTTRQRTENTVVSAEWTYFKKVSGSDNDKITILFNKNKITNINVTSNQQNCRNNTNTTNACAPLNKNVTSASLCHNIIKTGDTMQHVKSACGVPAQESVLQSVSKQIAELPYTNNVGPNVLVFEDGLLTDWKN